MIAAILPDPKAVARIDAYLSQLDPADRVPVDDALQALGDFAEATSRISQPGRAVLFAIAREALQAPDVGAPT